jgi:hypothetical protein
MGEKMSDDWIKHLQALVAKVSEETDESHFTVMIPPVENSPVANLMGLPEHEVSEWMARSQYKMMH